MVVIFVSLSSAAVLADGPEVGDWKGYVFVDNSVASDGTPLTAHLSNASASSGSTTVGAVETGTGYYLIHVTGTEGSKVDFKVCGIRAPLPSQNWSVGPHPNSTTGSPYINLSVSKLANGACSYSCGCSGGYCCSGATEYTAGQGTGTCQASACTAGTTATTSPPGGGGSVVTPTTTTTITTTTTTIPGTTTTTTTTIPPKEESKSIPSIEANATGAFDFVDPGLIIDEIEVTTTNAVSSPSITISQSSSISSDIAVAAPNVVYGYLTVDKSNIQDADVGNVKIKFKVTKSWIAENNIDESTIVLQRYSGGAWTALLTSKASEDGTYVYFEAMSPGLSVFAISGEATITTTTTTQTTTTTTLGPAGVGEAWMYWAIVIAIAAALAVFIFRMLGKKKSVG